MRGYGLVFGVAALVTFALLPLCIWLSRRFDVLAEPDSERRLHAKPTPLFGGIAMCVGFLVALVVASRFRQFHDMFAASSETLGIAVAVVLMTAVGAVDDVRPVSPPAKLAGQVVAGSALYFFGATLDAVTLPFSFGTVQISSDLTPLITVLWVIGMANAINLIDGVDGLAATVVAIASAAFFLYSDTLFDSGLISGTNPGPLVAAITCGVAVGFLPFNWTPAKVFMGDAGALLLGLLLATSTMMVGGRAVPDVPVRGQSYFFFAPLVIPLIILAVPIGDTARMIVTRSIRRKGITTADRSHLHYRLLELGHGPRRTVFILGSATAILSGFALAPLYFTTRVAQVPLLVLLILLLIFAVYHPDFRERRRREREEREERGADRVLSSASERPR